MNLSEETKAANRLKDPDGVTHCGCGVPFTLDCAGCKEYLGSEYHSPNEAIREENKPKAANSPDAAGAPVNYNTFIPKALHDRLMAHAMRELEGGNLMEMRETFVTRALREFVDREDEKARSGVEA